MSLKTNPMQPNWLLQDLPLLNWWRGPGKSLQIIGIADPGQILR
jgi:hypothetical protein